MKITTLRALSAIITLSIAASAAHAAVTVFTDRTTFTAATGTLPTETFEGASTPQTQFATPLDSTTTNPNVFFAFAGKAFVPGAILPGVHFNSIGSGQAFVGNNFLMDGSLSITAGLVTDSIDITFDNANAVGFDFGGMRSGNYIITAYNGDAVIDTSPSLDFTGGGMGFRGFLSTTPITRINLNATNPTSSSGYESFDNVSFGTAVAALPEPASLALLAFAALPLLRRRRA